MNPGLPDRMASVFCEYGVDAEEFPYFVGLGGIRLRLSDARNGILKCGIDL